MTPREQAQHIIDHHGSCTRRGNCTDSKCIFNYFCGPGADLLTQAKKILKGFETAEGQTEEAERQARITIENNGECHGEWDCEHCLLADYMEDPSECTERSAMDAAELILINSDHSYGRCKSIW